ncbi:hypothetical protein HDE_00453 [Halotydeus destructor]|nr:hypothetical protein HDE_00453 [Halotydeus destructor]
MSECFELNEEILFSVRDVLLVHCSVAELLRFSRASIAARLVATQELARRKSFDLRAPLLGWRDEDSFLKFIDTHASSKIVSVLLPAQFSLSTERFLASMKKFEGLLTLPSQQCFLEADVSHYVLDYAKLKELDAPKCELRKICRLLTSSDKAPNLESVCAKVGKKNLKADESFSRFVKLKTLKLIIQTGSPALYDYVDAFCALKDVENRSLILKITGSRPRVDLPRLKVACQTNQVLFAIEVSLSNSNLWMLDQFRGDIRALTLEIHCFTQQVFPGNGLDNLLELQYYSESSAASGFWVDLFQAPPNGLRKLGCRIFENDADAVIRFTANATALREAEIQIICTGEAILDRVFFSSISTRTSTIKNLTISFCQPIHSITMLFWFLLKNQHHASPIEYFEYRNLYSVPCFFLPVVLGLSRGLRKLVIGFENLTQAKKIELSAIEDYVRAERHLQEFQYEIYSDGTSERGHYLNGIFRSYAIRKPALLANGYVNGNSYPPDVADAHQKLQHAIESYDRFMTSLSGTLRGPDTRSLDRPNDFDFRADKIAATKLSDELLELVEDEYRVKAAFRFFDHS